MRRALIAGVGGQDGSYLAEALAAKDWHVVGLSGDAGGYCGHLQETLGDQFTLRQADLRDRATVTSLVEEVEPHLVVNLAALSSVAGSWEDPVTTIEINSLAGASLLEAAWQVGERTGVHTRFIQASSAEMFGDAPAPQDESTPLRPENPYGASKALMHALIWAYRARGMFASSAILYNHESPRRGESFVTRKITRTVAKISLGLEDRLVLGNLDSSRDWGWAPDYVDAMVRIGEAETPSDYVVATGEMRTVRDFAHAAFAAIGIDPATAPLESDPRFLRPIDAHEQRGDASKIRRELGWAPTKPFDQIVWEMVHADIEDLRG